MPSRPPRERDLHPSPNTRGVEMDVRLLPHRRMFELCDDLHRSALSL